MGTRMRLATIPTQPVQNENHRLMRTVFKRADLLDSAVLAVEQSTYFAGGRSPIHAEDDSEEVVYVRRGRGRVLIGDAYVEVGPGEAVGIPVGVEHHVVNAGDDAFEHLLLAADLADPLPADRPAACAPGDDLIAGAGLQRLSVRRLEVAPGERSPTVVFPRHEVVYALSGGFAVAHVSLADGSGYEWQYALDASNCVWLPPDRPHSFRNVGDCPLSIVGIHCLAPSPSATPTKEKISA